MMIFFFSCKTIPTIPDTAIMETLPLSSGASVYLIANARQALPVINLFPMEELNDRQTRQMLERTDFFAAALFPPESGRRLQLTAWGNYPSMRAELAFSANRNWEKQNPGGDSFWYSSANGLSIAMNSKQAFVVSSVDGIPARPASSSPGVIIPEDFNEFSRGSPLSCWLENSAQVITGIFSSAGVPIQFPVQQLFINFYPASYDRCEALIRMKFESSSHARGAMSILSVAQGYLPADFSLAQVFFANPPVQNDSFLDIKTASLDRSAIALFFGLFLAD